MDRIKIAIAGVGNCTSSLIQGLFYYKSVDEKSEIVSGLMHNVIGGYKISDIEPVAAFDVDKRKVGRDLSEAIFALPNNAKIFYGDLPNLNVKVEKGPVLDGFPKHMEDYDEAKRFVIDNKQRELNEKEVVSGLRKSGAEILINYMPVGAQEATEFYARCSLEAHCAFINCMPVFICSNDVTFSNRFFKKLCKYKKVESWGDVLNNMGKMTQPIVEINKDIKSKGETKEHVATKFLEPYKFTIAFENSCTDGYTTEKLCEAMLANTIPIFYGNQLVGRDFNTKSFINCFLDSKT